MKRFTQVILPFLILFAFGVFVSCSKSDSLHSYPKNTRLSSMVVTTTDSTGFVLHENYSFFYDGQNRLSQELYTTDDTSIYDLVSYFAYSSDSVYKTVYYKYTHDALKETDYFIVNSSNQIQEVVMPGVDNTFQYYKQLISGGANKLTSNSYTYKANSGNNLYLDSTFSNSKFTTYYVYYGLSNRIGDYLQLNSFATYGFNFYNNASLINTITDYTGVTTATYTIDANNLITRTVVTKNDGNNTLSWTQQYDLSYQNY